ncbi:LOW QUALITY PROTEIN: zinc finger FYVE domain-containing protein 16 [Pogonomyrmex barbatus]|uniref:LOW QUALITY PROTEIN: zinc finger FYVE domain-containing protein 16 n=1 Tax=Pogonomyrmex barbatus TaxID=144034 RepID=A0A6I9W1B0_9HYME|nr:LOW QUALITY PROTEIN: zinc finger FYVE domain-containing protein 16 [Pogonomyrmex barbatus]
MEKFMIDLDKVLNDFEFNEDCAEQIASVANSTITVSAVEKCANESVPSRTSHLNPEKDVSIDVVSPVEKHKDTRPLEIDSNYSSSEKSIVFISDSKDSVSNLYTHDCINDIKTGQKPCVYTHDSDQVSLTMYNDISHNSMQKQLNTNSDSKDVDRYDQKLNQPNFKPSISNVFNSLNEYINAPTGSLNYIDSILDKTDDLSKKSTDTIAGKDFRSSRDVTINERSVSTEKEVVNLTDKNSLEQKNILPLESSTFVEVKSGNKQDNTIQNVTFLHSTLQSEENNSDTTISITNTAISKHNNNNIIVDTKPSTNKNDIDKKVNDYTLTENSDNIISKQKQLNLDSRDSIDKYMFVETKENIVENVIKLNKNLPKNENYDKNVETAMDNSVFSNVHTTYTINTNDDFSEEELNQYLLELEKEESSKIEKISHSDDTWLPKSYNELTSNKEKNTTQCQQDDEDVNEAPIFEKIMIGELPKISQEEFHEKTKKFSVIDYSTDVCNENVMDAKCNNIVKITSHEKSNQLKDVQNNELDKMTKDNIIESQDVVVQESTLQDLSRIAIEEKVTSKFEHIGGQLCNNSNNINITQKLQDSTESTLSQNDKSDVLLNLSENKQDHDKKVYYQDITDNSKEDVHETKIHNSEKISKMETVSKIADACAVSHVKENDQEAEKPTRPQTLDIVLIHKDDSHTPESSSAVPGELVEPSEIDATVDEDRGASSDISDNSLVECNTVLGKQPPFWVPDSDAPSCMLCDVKFTVLKRRHHCRACGKVLCNKCCNMKYRLEYQGNIDSRVCVSCYHLLTKAENEQNSDWSAGYNSYTDCSNANSAQVRQPNPNNPMEYCSTIPPLQQLAGALPPPPTVMVPVGVLKREGSKHRAEGQKSVMFSDVIDFALAGNTMTELGFSIYQGTNLLGSREHAGFLFIRQTLQCLQKIILPPAPFLIGLLIHRWETPWAKVFPLRLLLRLGAEYRYYPCPLVSVRFRDALYFEIGHTVMKVLADFRNFSYTLPGVRGLTIHLKNRTTDVMFPRNRYDQVIKGLHNSNDHVLAYASNFSITADSHLVCIQTNTGDESSYQTQAINIHNKPRTVTGASFIVINGALKSSMGLSAKSSIVEDGLMVEIMPEKMEALKAALKNMQDFSIGCGHQGALEPDETVNIKWVDNDVLFNLGVKSPIDGQLMDGIPSIRVHNGIDYKGATRFIRWTEVFIIKSDDHSNGVNEPVDINKLSSSIAKATCAALVKLLDLLATAGLTKLGVRTTIHPDNVGYEAGSEGTRLPPIYMKSLDNELIQVLHKAVQSSQDAHTVLELIFYVLED